LRPTNNEAAFGSPAQSGTPCKFMTLTLELNGNKEAALKPRAEAQGVSGEKVRVAGARPGTGSARAEGCVIRDGSRADIGLPRVGAQRFLSAVPDASETFWTVTLNAGPPPRRRRAECSHPVKGIRVLGCTVETPRAFWPTRFPVIQREQCKLRGRVSNTLRCACASRAGGTACPTLIPSEASRFGPYR
jgi:hypothetical protein